jgi:hypothetical protein
MRQIQPSVEQNDLDLLLQPPARTQFTGGPAQRKSNALQYERLLDVILTVLLGPAILLPVVFEVHAFYVLFKRFQASDILVWICLSTTALLLAAAWATIIIWANESD